MRKLFLICLFTTISFATWAQEDKPFHCELYNDEYKVFFKLNFYDKDIIVPGQEIFGNLDGYLGSRQTTQVWAITRAIIIDKKSAKITLINNYGSEDLTATLTRKNDSTYVYKFIGGSTLKFPVSGKWQKIPKQLEFKRK